MSKISIKKLEVVKSDVLGVLYDAGIIGMFTKKIADETGRDDEMILRLLIEMRNAGLVRIVKKSNVSGKIYNNKRKWVMSESAYEVYERLR